MELMLSALGMLACMAAMMAIMPLFGRWRGWLAAAAPMTAGLASSRPRR